MYLFSLELGRVELDPNDTHITYASKPNGDHDYAPDIQVRVLREYLVGGEGLPDTLPDVITLDGFKYK